MCVNTEGIVGSCFTSVFGRWSQYLALFCVLTVSKIKHCSYINSYYC